MESFKSNRICGFYIEEGRKEMELNEGMHRYARVLVQKGVSLKSGQKLCIEAPVEASNFVKILAEEAYEVGCSQIGLIWKSGQLERVKMDHEPIKVQEYEKVLPTYYAEEGSAFIRLDYPDFHTFAGVDAEKLNAKAIADKSVRSMFQGHDELGQTIACIPNQDWADQVFPELPVQERLAALWDVVLSCVRCDEGDPVERWNQFISETNKRKKYLADKGYVAFHYQSAKTDFTIRPIDTKMWAGGCMECEDGFCFTPNIPTEEVFTMPQKYSACGYVSSTKPLCYKGQIIEDFVLHFENGKIVRWEAKKGQELLDAIIATDEGSCYFGEMAFVDESSPIASAGKVFYTTLFDENASCHLAIGNAYGPADPQVREKFGFNSSSIHVDFMIGSKDLNIQGQLEDGTWEDVFVNGHWVTG